MTKNYNSPFEHVDYNAMIDTGNGVKTGLAVTERGAGQNMSVDVAAGTAWIDNIEYVEASTVNVVITAADATHPRKDIIIYDVATTNPAVVTGTPAAEPIPPNITSDDILLAIINIAANETTIANTDIEDGRVLMQEHHTSHELDGYDYIESLPLKVVASDTVLHTNATERSTPNLHMVKIKETWISSIQGDIRITFDIKSSNGSEWVYAKVYVNSAAKGALLSTQSTSYVTKTENSTDVTFGDLVQIYGGAGNGGVTTYIENFIIKGTVSNFEYVDQDP